MRCRAADAFGLDSDDLNERHHLIFDTYEEGKLSLDAYLDRVVFCQKRNFSRREFKKFMFAQSKPFPEMLRLVAELRARYGLKIAVVSNEGRELMEYRIRKFRLAKFIDFFIASCFVHFRKPDEDIFRIALDIAHTPAERVVYIEDRAMFVEVAKTFGIHGIHHTGFESTRKALEGLGLVAGA